MCNQHLREYSHGQERTRGTAQKMKFSNKDLATFTGEILNGNVIFVQWGDKKSDRGGVNIYV